MPPVEEQKVNTSVGPETLSQTVTRAKKLLEPVVTAEQLTNDVTQVQVPEPQTASIPSQTSRIVNNVTRDVNGFISAQTEEAKRLQELQDTYGALSNEGSLSDLFKQQREAFGATPEVIQELKDIDLQLADMQTASDLTKVQIQGADGQTIAQSQREVTQEDREAAVRSAGLAARAAVLRGNIETANTLARDAVNIAYQDRQLKSQNLINQIEMVQGQVDEQTAQLLEQEKRQYEADLAKIQEVKDSVANAMVNGATQAEMAQLTDPTIDDEAKIALANSITARGAGEMRNLNIQQTQASIANSYSAIADRDRRYELDLLKFEQESVDKVKAEMEAAATKEEAKQIENAAKSEKALAMLASINELSTHEGFKASVGPNPLARVDWNIWAGPFAGLFTGNKSEFKSDVDRLANTLTLENMDLLKGPATDKDVEIVAASMSRLKNMDVTEKGYMEEVGRLQAAAERIVRNVGATPEQLQFYGVTDVDTINEADAIWGTPTSSNEINFDY